MVFERYIIIFSFFSTFFRVERYLFIKEYIIMIRTKEHNNKIAQGVKRYYALESDEKKAERFRAIEERNALERQFKDKLKEVFDIYEKLNLKF